MFLTTWSHNRVKSRVSHGPSSAVERQQPLRLAQQPSGAIDISAQHAQQRLVVRTFCEQSGRACGGTGAHPTRPEQRRLWTENPINMDLISFTWSSDKVMALQQTFPWK